MIDAVRFDTRQLNALLRARGLSRQQLLAFEGIDGDALRQAEMCGLAPWPLARALADALEVAPGVLDPDSPQARRRRERQTTRVVLLLCFLFLGCAAFGYRVGADLAARDNRADCIASGGDTCVGG